MTKLTQQRHSAQQQDHFQPHDLMHRIPLKMHPSMILGQCLVAAHSFDDGIFSFFENDQIIIFIKLERYSCHGVDRLLFKK